MQKIKKKLNFEVDDNLFMNRPTDGEYVLSASQVDDGIEIKTISVDDNGDTIIDTQLCYDDKSTIKAVTRELKNTCLKLIEINNPSLYNKIVDMEVDIAATKMVKGFNLFISLFMLGDPIVIGSVSSNPFMDTKQKWIIIIMCSLTSLYGAHCFEEFINKTNIQKSYIKERELLINSESRKFVRIRK